MLLTTNCAIKLRDDDLPRVDPDTMVDAPHWPYDKIQSGKPGSFFMS